MANLLWNIVKSPWDAVQWGSEQLLGGKPIIDPNNKGLVPFLTWEGNTPAQPQNQNTKTESGPMLPGINGISTGNGGGTASNQASQLQQIADMRAQLEAKRAQLEAKRAQLGPQFNSLADKMMSDAQSQYDTGKTQYDQSYQDMLNNLNKSFGEQVQGNNRYFTGKGLTDSSYAQNAAREADLGFGQSVGRLDQNKQQSYSSLDSQLKKIQEQVSAARNNFYNPETPVFTDMNQAMSYGSQLDNQFSKLADTESQLKSALSSYSAPQAQSATYLDFLGKASQINQMNLPTELKSQALSSLTGSYFSNSGDQDKWMKYFESNQQATL